MIPLTLRDMQIVIAGSVFLLGFLCILMGAFVLISRGYSREVRALAAHTARLAQKGVAQEVSGLVTSASQLVGAINELVRTASGIGVFLISLGLVMIVSSFWVIQQIPVA
ncbi:MAG TPA: hypothetical protein VGA32_05615 [Anaerolineales bacterium]